MFDHMMFGEEGQEYVQVSDMPFGDFMVTNLLREFVRNIFSLNRGFEFSPLVATFLFIIGSVNFVCPKLWNHLRRIQTKNIWPVVSRSFVIFLLYHYVWVPVNRQISCLVRLVFLGSDQTAGYLSLIAALAYLGLSYVYINRRLQRGKRNILITPVSKSKKGKRNLSLGESYLSALVPLVPNFLTPKKQRSPNSPKRSPPKKRSPLTSTPNSRRKSKSPEFQRSDYELRPRNL